MSQNNTTRAVILFTKNWAGKGQAGKYAADAVDRALAVASKNGCSAILFTPDDDADLLAAVPEGRFGAQDRPLLPSAKVAIFKRLVAMAEQQAHEGRTDAHQADAAPQTTAAEADAVKPADDQPHAKAATPQAAAMLAKTSEKAAGGTIVSVIVKDGATHWPDLVPRATWCSRPSSRMASTMGGGRPSCGPGARRMSRSTDATSPTCPPSASPSPSSPPSTRSARSKAKG